MIDVLPYFLSIDPQFEAYRPELEYACAFLDRAHFVERSPERVECILHYGSSPPADAVVVPAALFPNHVRLDEDGIHLRRDGTALTEVNELAVFQVDGSNDDGMRGTSYDALGLIFFMLSRIEERDSTETDRYGRFKYDAALATKTGHHADPLADQAALDLVECLYGRPKPANRTLFKIRLTHDVDMLRGYHRFIEPLRYAAGDAIKRGQPITGLSRLRSAYFGREPWRSFRHLLNLSEHYSLRGHFNFLGPSQHRMDSPYAINMSGLLRRVADEVQRRGHAIGFHPGYETMQNREEWSRQHKGLEAIVGTRLTEGRQHVLRYDAARTPDIWEAEAMARDDTLSFPEATGFRSGTSRVFSAYSLRYRRTMRLEQCATAVMDFGLFDGKYRNLSVEDALDDCRPAHEACRKYGGELVILYHSGVGFKNSPEFFSRLLEEVA